MKIEKKYRLSAAQIEDVLGTLKEIDAEFTGEDHEENIIFSNAALLENQAVLRLRRIGERTILTYKRKAESLSDAKHHIEHETEVANFDEIRAIVENLGFSRVLVYEKRRRKWRFRQVEIVLDALPFGDFMEIEGSITAIAEAELFLGADDFEVVPQTYPNLTLRYGKNVGGVMEARFEGD